jgi:hypothetical protein
MYPKPYPSLYPTYPNHLRAAASTGTSPAAAQSSSPSAKSALIA